MDKETADKVRGMIRRCTLRNVNDDGETQTCSVEVADGIWRDNVEVLQPYGFAAHVPEDGALGIVLAVGGDEGDIVVLPVANPSKRMGKLGPGEVGVYNEHGDKAVLTAGGDLNVKTGANVHVETKQSATITAEDSVSITAETCQVNGNFNCTGDVSDHSGSMQVMRDLYNAHGHPDAQAPPNPLQE